jgi:hypothetical protein
VDGETILSIILGVGLAAFSVILVGYSFLRKSGRESTVQAAHSSLEGPPVLEAVEGPGIDSVFEAINTLELEYQLGNIPEAQYQEQLEAYRIEAAAALKTMLESGNAGPAWALEREVLEAGASVRQTSPRCPECGSPLPRYDDTCPECGVEVAPGRPARSPARGARDDRDTPVSG